MILLILQKSYLNKTKHVDSEKELNDIPEKVKLISTRGLTKHLIKGYSILNGAKYFVEDESQNYLIFQLLVKYFEASRNL